MARIVDSNFRKTPIQRLWGHNKDDNGKVKIVKIV